MKSNEQSLEEQKKAAEIQHERQKLDKANQIIIIGKECEIYKIEKNNTIETEAKVLDNEFQRKTQELDYKVKEFNMIKEKMNDANYVKQLRADVIESTYTNANYETQFKLDQMEGSDSIVMAVDNLINA